MSRWRIGIDLGGTKTEVVALDPQGQLRGRRRIATPQHDYEASLRAMAELVQSLEQEFAIHAPVGVGTPGSLDPLSGRMKSANTTWLVGRHLRHDLSQALARPIRLRNDADCFTLSEATDGAGQDAAVVFGVIIGTGTGGGVAVNGKLLASRHGIAGEWGHIALPWPQDNERPGPDCFCGLQGCIETYLCGPALSADHRRHTGQDCSCASIVAAAEDGNPAANATLARYESRLARGLAMVINLLDPDVIVLGGGLSNIQRLYDNVPKLWGQWVFSTQPLTTQLLPPRHGDSSGVRGAAWLWP